jgi:hypothetical protein
MSLEQRDEEMNGSHSGLPATPDLGTWSEKPLTTIPLTSHLVAADVTFQNTAALPRRAPFPPPVR